MSDATFRIRRQRPFTQIDNEMISDKRLSVQALGLGVRMLRLNPDYEYSAKYIQSLAGVGRDKFQKLCKELVTAGYLDKVQTHDEKGKFRRNCYEIVDISTVSPLPEKPSTVLPSTENQATVSISKNNNISPYNPPEGDESAENKKICSWNEQRFLRFWKFYRSVFCASDPSRAGERAAAAAAWDKLKPDDITIGKMGAKLEAIMTTRQWQDGYGIKMASTFLNGIRLRKIDLDELPEAVISASAPQRPPDEPREEAFGVWH